MTDYERGKNWTRFISLKKYCKEMFSEENYKWCMDGIHISAAHVKAARVLGKTEKEVVKEFFDEVFPNSESTGLGSTQTMMAVCLWFFNKYPNKVEEFKRL